MSFIVLIGLIGAALALATTGDPGGGGDSPAAGGTPPAPVTGDPAAPPDTTPPTTEPPAPGQPPAEQFRFQLTPEQREQALKDGFISLDKEHFAGEVQSRMSTYAEDARKAKAERDALLAEKKAAADAKLAEQGEWQKLAQSREDENTQLSQARVEDNIRFAFMLESVRSGVVDPELAFLAAQKLPEFSGVQYQDGQVTGVGEVLTALLAAKPYLAQPTNRPGPIGSSTNPPPSQLPPAKTLAEAGDRFEADLRRVR